MIYNEDETPNVLGIFWWIKEDGTIRYRCRGIGKQYDRFYQEWVPGSSYRCTSTDWPWDFFVFDDPKDHDRLLKDFPAYVIEDND
jgi:hypothetical protein